MTIEKTIVASASAASISAEPVYSFGRESLLIDPAKFEHDYLTTPSVIYVPKLQDILDIYDQHERAHWIKDRIDLRTDVEQWKIGKITEGNKNFIKMVLRGFTQRDKDVEDAYVDRLLRIYKHPDLRIAFLSAANRESTHMRAYKHLNDTLGFSDEAFMSEFMQFKETLKVHEFLMEPRELNTAAQRAKYLATQCLAEGVGLFGQFCMLLSFSREAKLPGMVSVNEWSIAEEGLHATTLAKVFLYQVDAAPHIVNNFFKAEIYAIARAIVKMEDDFIDLCYSVGENTAVTAQECKDYVRHVCDYRMVQLGLKPQFGITENPLPFIDQLLANPLTNFFEDVSVQYSKSNSSGQFSYPELSVAKAMFEEYLKNSAA